LRNARGSSRRADRGLDLLSPFLVAVGALQHAQVAADQLGAG
jgi:hypothetical protein